MSNATETVTLTAPDISCAHCVATITREVGGLEGVSRVEADESTKRVVVAYDPGRTSVGAIESAMEDAGYPAQR